MSGYLSFITQLRIVVTLLSQKEAPLWNSVIIPYYHSYTEDNTRVKRVRVILNPHGGKGDAQQVFNSRILPILQIAGIQCDIEITKYSGNVL